jgi:hypothetical protein
MTGIAGGTDSPAQFGVYFSEAVTGLDATDFALGGTSTGWSVHSPSSIDGAGYTLTVDSTSPLAGSLTLTLAAGSVSGVNLAGPAAPFTVTTTVDVSPPSVSTPAASFRSGASLSGTQLPMQLSWVASDAETGVRDSKLEYSTDGGTSWAILSSHFVGSTALLIVDPSGSLRFRVTPTDWAGHVGATMAGPTFSPRLVQQGSSSVSYSGSWTKGSYSKYSGGSVRYTSTGKRSATYSFTGRAVAFITTISGSRGEVRIKVDGVQVARIDLGKTPTAYRRLAWATKFSSVHAHKVQIVVIGGYGRVDIDAFAVLK